MADAHELGLTARATGFKEAAKDMDDLTIAAKKVENASAGVEKATKKTTPAVKETGKAVEETGNKAGKAKPKVDGFGEATERAGKRSGKAKPQVDGMGKSTKQTGDQAQVAAPKVDAFGEAAQRSATRAKSASTQMRLASMQISQIAQQTTAGTSFMQAFAIQLPDLMLGFGTLGILAGAAVGPLLAVGAAMVSGAKDAEEMETKLNDLIDAIDRVSSARSGSTTSLTGLAGDYGSRAANAQNLLAIETEIARVVAQRALTAASGSVAGSFGGIAEETGSDVQAMLKALISLEEGYDDALDIIYNPSRAVGDNPVIQQLAEDMGVAADKAVAKLSRFRNNLIELQNKLDVTPDQADRLADALARMGTAEGVEAQVSAAEDLSVAIFEATGGLEGMDDATLDLYQSLLEVAKQGQKLAGLDMSAPMAAVDAYAKRTAQLNDLLNERALAEEALATAMAENNTHEIERAEQAIDAIDKEAESITDATGRLEDMNSTLDVLEKAMASAEFDNEGELRQAAKEAREQLKAAADNADNLSDADLTALEASMRALASFAQVMSGGLASSVESLGQGATISQMMQGYGNAYRSMEYSRQNPDLAFDQRTRDAAGRGILDLIAAAEGTDAGDGYNETLGYGAYTGGDVDLVNMTLRQVYELQQRMLAHPDNSYNSSAAGRYQIVGQTLKDLVDNGNLGLDWDRDTFNSSTQDRMAQALLRRRQGQGYTGMVNEWQGLGRVDPSLVTTAMQNSELPAFDAAGERAMEAAAREAETLARAREQLMNQYQGMVAGVDAVAAVELKYKDALDLVNEAEQANLITAEEAALRRTQAAVQRDEGLAKVKEEAQATRETYESLMASLDPLTAATLDYRDALAVVDEALKAGTISEEEAQLAREAAKRALDETIEKIDEMGKAGRRGAQALSDMFISILDGSSSGKEALASLLEQIAKVQIAKAMIGLSEMGGATGGFFSALGEMLTMPSADGGGWTGNGARAGGLDGKGGFPVMVHPREQIIDTTKPGQQMGGSQVVDVRVGIDGDGNIGAFVDRRANQAAQQRVSEYNQGFGSRLRQHKNDVRKR